MSHWYKNILVNFYFSTVIGVLLLFLPYMKIRVYSNEFMFNTIQFKRNISLKVKSLHAESNDVLFILCISVLCAEWCLSALANNNKHIIFLKTVKERFICQMIPYHNHIQNHKYQILKGQRVLDQIWLHFASKHLSTEYQNIWFQLYPISPL